MSTTRSFSYNPSRISISGTTQIGDLSVGYPSSGYTGMVWWNGPDEELGYVIAQSVSGNTQPSNVPEDKVTLSTTYKGVDVVLSNNNQTATQIFGYQQSILGETIISGTNKVIFSVLCNLLEPNVLIGGHVIGVGLTSMNYSSQYGAYPGNDIYSIGFSDDGKYYFDGSVDSTGYPTWTDGDTIDIAIAHGQYWWVRVNGGDWNNNPSANPSTLTGGSLMNGLTDFFPVLCPSYQGIMTMINYPKYGTPLGYNFLGDKTGSVGFFRTDGFDEGQFISLANSILNQNYTGGTTASIALTNNGYWNSWVVPPTPTPTISPTPTPTPTISPTPTPTISPTPTPTPTPTTTSGVTFSQSFTGGTAPTSSIETAWNTFRSQLTGTTYTQFVWSSTNGNSLTVSDPTLVQTLATSLRTATITGVTINSVSWRVGTGCGTPKIGGVAVEFSNIGSCNASSTYALRPMINNSNWGGTNQSTVGAPSQTITLTFS